MKLEQSFEVAAPLERVWKALIDVQRVAPCLPGAAVTGRNDDGSYNGTFRVKIGPTSAAYSGKLQMEQIDESGHTATMQAQGTDRRGQGGAKATIVSSLSGAGDAATRVDVSTEYHITGRLARFGRGGMIEDISNKLLREFAKCLQSSLAGSEGASVPQGAAAGPTGSADSAASAEPAADPAASAEPAAAVGREQTPPLLDTPPAHAATQPTRPVNQPQPAAPVSPPVPESEPVQGLSLMASALWSQTKRNPAPIAALVVGFLLALIVFRRRG